jgi:pyrimidine operon attenuation protein / uracil phosphoribosyltransferase
MQQTILTSEDIDRKLKRMAIEITENNFAETEIVLLGIFDRGLYIAKYLQAELQKQKSWNVYLGEINIDKKNPLQSAIEIKIDTDLKNKTIIIVDDVANSGKTIFYALKPLMDLSLNKIQLAVLVDRQHKSFPITADYVGLSISTTLQNMIYVEIGDGVANPNAYLV